MAVRLATGRLSRAGLRVELSRAQEHLGDLLASRAQKREGVIDGLIEHLTDGLALVSPDGHFLDVNAALCVMTGFSRNELVGCGVPAPFWPPEEQDALQDALRRHLEGQATSIRATFMRRSGERFPVLITPSSLRDEHGPPFYVFAGFRDLSDEQRSDRALRESERRYRSIFANAPIGIFQTTADGRMVAVNPAFARLLGYASVAELVEVVDREGFAQTIYEDPDKRRHLLEEAQAAGGEGITFESRFRRADGSLLTGLVNLREERDPTTGELCLFGFAQDVTSEREATEALERSAQLLSQGERLAHLGSWAWDIVSGTLAASAEWQRMHGLVGECLTDDEVMATCHTDDRQAIWAALDEAHAGGDYRVDHRIVHPETHEVRHLTTFGKPVFSDEGRLESVIGASLDVTERTRADQALLEREERLRQALADTVEALGATVAMRDPYTARHERRVAQLACLMAERLGWSEEAIERLRMAALVHDVGKIAVPADILSKPSRLQPAEFELIKGHAQAGYEILMPIAFGGPVADLVWQHHERLDGSGYPRGLRGEEILPGACVLAVADVVEAMVSHRPYRPALPLVEALAEIASGAGVRYDAEVVEVCRQLFEKEGYNLPE
jgi:PAS domain S-box-containing protein